MIQIASSQNIWLAYTPVDFRKGIDGLIALCKYQLRSDPFDGSIYVFRNKRGTALKIFSFDGTGTWLHIRRFSQGSIRWWPQNQSDTPVHLLAAQQLHVLIFNGLPERADFLPQWKPVQAARRILLSAESTDL